MALTAAREHKRTFILSALVILLAVLSTGCGRDWKLGSWYYEEDEDTDPTTSTSLFINDVSAPWGLAADGTHLYATDVSTHFLMKYSIADLDDLDNPDNLVWEFGGYGTEEREFHNPEGVAVDLSGNVYVADRGNGRIQKFDSDGIFISQWDTSATFTEPDQLSDPTGIAIDGAGFVYVADGDNDQIVKFTANGTYFSHWGTEGTGLGQLNQPRGLYVDKVNELLYVVDGNNKRVQVFTLTGDYQRHFGSSGTEDGQFSSPWGVVVDPVRGVYVTDRVADRVQLFSTSGDFTKVLTIPDSEDPLDQPTGAVITSGYLWLCETTPNRIRAVER